MERSSGILMPVFSLPGGYGIGTLGEPARRFVSFLRQAGQSVWQILPVGPTGYGNSPYQSCSAFAGSPYLIDLELLARQGLLDPADYRDLPWGLDPARVDYSLMERQKMPLLRKAYRTWRARRPLPGCDTWRTDDFYAFLFRSQDWLEDYALFMAAKAENDGRDWQQWPQPLRARQPQALAELAQRQAEELEFWRFVQYVFDRQWTDLKQYANQNGVRIMGDLPIYVSADSSDAWAGGALFEVDAQGHPLRVAGCPPDFFCADGQLWGNPLYDWAYHKRTGYAWWIGRMRRSLEIYDMVRIDHFRGFDTYWAIPAKDTNARGGKWEQGPGMDLFRALTQALGPLPVVAEDLGEIFDSVRQLLRDSGYPGMKVLQFGFSGPDNEFLPHNHIQNCVVYPGTHDNTTIRAWLESEGSPAERRYARQYLPCAQGESPVQAWLRAVQASPAALAVIPLADWLELGPEARINTPGTVGGGNWSWRCLPQACTHTLAGQIRQLSATYGRCRRS